MPLSDVDPEELADYLAQNTMGHIEIACCPEHGLHGSREDCFECGGPVKQVPMVHLERAEAAESKLRRLERIEAVARSVYADMQEFPYEESGFGAEDFSRLTANEAALAAALQEEEAP